MKNIIAGLKWMAKFLENRFPEKLDLSMLASKKDLDMLGDLTVLRLEKCEAEVTVLKEQNKKFQEQIQILSLRSGLIRPMQTVLKEKI